MVPPACAAASEANCINQHNNLALWSFYPYYLEGQFELQSSILAYINQPTSHTLLTQAITPTMRDSARWAVSIY
ncbi:hypothetical protein ACU8KH_01115 [Lachancea thermotolerans]